MKKLNLLALAFVFGTASLFASNNGILDIPVNQIRAQVADLFKSPEFTVEEDINVNILFTFNTSGEIVVLKIDSKDKNVLNYVEKNLNHKKIQTPGELNRVFTMPLKLKQE